MNLTYTYDKNLFSAEKIKELNKKINKILSGKRRTLAIWMYGPRFK